jgi:surface polysaccharide O-acyltransferase-like enzyme
MAVAFGSMHWWAFGPFTVQTSRVLHYALYFFVGVALGGLGLERSIVREGGPLSRRWIVWPMVSLVAFAIAAGIAIAAATSLGAGAAAKWEAIGAVGFVLSCAASSCAMLAVFLRFARRSSAIADSLRNNAYGIFLVHYAFVSWLQYSLMSSSVGAVTKAVIVAAGVLVLSWATSAALRTIPAVRRVV